MSPEEEKEVQILITSIPALKGVQAKPQRLGGLTNKVYALGDYVLRLPGKGTEDYINRMHEAEMAKRAAEAGVSPKVIHADPASGILVSEHVKNAVTMSPARFKEITGSVSRAAESLRQLHRSGKEFPSRFELFAVMNDYAKILSKTEVDLPKGYHDVVREAEAIRTALAKAPAQLTPCHCDPLCENFLDTGSRMWIVDWEYGGMNDPMWDLGDLSIEGTFTEAQDQELLRAYFKGDPSPQDHGRMVIYKAMADLLWSLWGLIQHANKNPADDFAAYALNRFNRCRELMASKDFARHLAAI